MDIQHFGIIVNALLSWGDEPRPPKKASGRHSAPAAPRDGLEDEDELIEDDDFEADEEPGVKPDADDPDGELVESDLAADSEAD